MNLRPAAAAATFVVLVSICGAAAAKDCTGSFIRRSCKLGAAEGMCAYPKERGTVEDFMGWEREDGVLGYTIYRLGAYPAKDIVIEKGCRLSRYN